MLLRVENIHKSYGDAEILKGVSFDMEPGQSKVIMGPSGTGKSTLLRCINHLTEPDQGHVFVDGEELTSKNLNAMRQKVAFVFQDFNLFTHLRTVDNVAI